VQDEGGLAGRVDLARLGRSVIGVEDEGIGLDLLQKDHPDVRKAIGIHRRKRDRVGIVRLPAFGFLQPRSRDCKGIVT